MYVFFMDKGQLIQLNETPPSVSSLQAMLSQKLELKIEKQILLVSGGFLLHPKDRLPVNGAGLDKTNPIYVFTRVSNENDCVKQPDILQVCDGGYLSKLEQSLSLPSTYENLTKCSQLVELIAPIAQQTRNAVEKLMCEQSQMIQGWNVALANLAEVAAETEKRLSAARIDLALFENCHTMWQQKFHQISDLKRDLSQVPLLPQLSQQFRCLGDEREGMDSHDSSSVPSNLYEWVCLQSTLSLASRSGRRGSTANCPTTASRLQIRGLFLGARAGVRSRTTSVGQLEENNNSSMDIPTPPLHGGIEDYRRSPGLGSAGPGARHSFYATSSQPSLNSLLASCATTKSTSPSGLSGVVIGLQSEPNAPTTQEPDAGWDSYEVDFLTIIRDAQQQLNFLRFGSKSAPENQTEFEGEITYAQRQLIQLHELLTLVSNSSARVSPSGESLSDANTEGEEHRLSPSTAPNLLPCLSADLITRSKEALSRSYFSQRLNHVDKLVLAANEMVNEIQEIMRSLLERCKCGPKGRTLPDFTADLRTVMSAFRQLCDLLDQAMDSKLQLAHTLRERQRWLQNIQSQLGKLDVSIQKCVHNCKCVRTMATVVTQLQKAPEVYIRGLVEVARQHDFEHCFVQLSREQQKLGTDEVQRRSVFADQINENILHSLFSPWTAIKGDRCMLTRSHGRGLHSPDLDTITDTSDVTCRPLGTNSGAPNQSPRNTRKTNAYARSSVNSRSEPQLSKLAKTAARLSLRSRHKDTIFTNPVLHEVHEDEAAESRATEFSPPRNSSSTNLLMDRWLRVQNRPQPSKEDVLRRASYPVDLDGTFPPAQSPWTIEDSDGGSTETTDTNSGSDIANHSSCITTDDLIKLAHILPPNLGDYLQQEIMRASLRRSILPSGLFDALRPTVEHMGLCPRSVSSDRSRNPSQTLPKSSVVLVDATCQVEMSLLSSPVAQWPLRSHSASLFLPVNDSPSRPTTITWEPTPSSACSWDLCHIPINRSLKRSVSMNAIANIPTLKTRATQTDGVLDADSTSAPRSAALSLASSSYTTPDTLLFPASNATAATKTDSSGLLVSQSETGCLSVDREQLNVDSLPERLHSTLSLNQVVELVNTAATANTVTNEHSNGTDADFATPSTMMSSFHSTRTNLSNAGADGWLHTQSADQDEWDRKSLRENEDLGATPTVRQDQWLRHRERSQCAESPTHFGVATETGDYRSHSYCGSSMAEANCSCHLRSLHTHCVGLMKEYTGALLAKLPTRRSVTAKCDNNEAQVDSAQMERLGQLIQLLSSYTADYPLSPCSVHPMRRATVSLPFTIPSHNIQTSWHDQHVGACSTEHAECPAASVTPQTSTTCIQTDAADLISRSTSITPPPSPDNGESPNLAKQETEQPTNVGSPSSRVVDASSTSNCTSPAKTSQSQSIIRFLPNPLNLGSITILERCLTFVHANFTMNDTVIFVPVRGSSAHTPKSSSRARAAENRESDDQRQSSTSIYPPQTSGFLRAISPSSSMLSSTIIQSMDPQVAVEDAGPSRRRHRDLMYNSLNPATSALISDLIGNGTDPDGSGSARRSNATRDANHPTTACAAVTQWRMLSSDGHVYFLHQDDFARLNLDIHTDYCQPSTSLPRGSHPHRNFPASVTNLPHSDAHFIHASSCDKSNTSPSEATHQINSEQWTCFVVASYQRKERCLSKRVDNRFNLPINFAFYRVRAKPVAVSSDVTTLLTDP